MLKTMCSACLADLIFPAGKDLAYCNACGRVNARPKSNAEKTNLLKYANQLRAFGNFREAESYYRDVLAQRMDEHEARMGLVYCRYGVIHVKDERAERWLPTCRLENGKPMATDADFRQAYADAADEGIRAQYMEDAEYIDRIQRRIAALNLNAEPYDVFICYKETDLDDGRRTEDSEIAGDIYEALSNQGLRVFYARKTLNKQLGADYEAQIYHAIRTSGMMLVVGTKAEHFRATWVRSEWRRFLDDIDAGMEKCLVPVFKGMHENGLPTDFVSYRFQGVNLDKFGAGENLLKMVVEYTGKKRVESGKNGVSETTENAEKEDEIHRLQQELERLKKAEEERKRREEEEKNPDALYERAEKLFDKSADEEKNAEAIRLYKLAAERGHLEAQKQLYEMYHRGLGAKENYAEAVKWLRMAAEQGDSWAEFFLGYCYDFGVGVECDVSEAIRWYLRAAEHGDRDVFPYLGSCYSEKGDYAEALKCYLRDAREKNSYVSMKKLGELYEEGMGAPADLDEAEKWYRMAVERGYEDARKGLDRVIAKKAEERKKREAEAARKAEEERKKHEAEEAARKAEEERKKREAEAARKAEEERKKREAEEAARKAEEERKKREAEEDGDSISDRDMEEITAIFNKKREALEAARKAEAKREAEKAALRKRYSLEEIEAVDWGKSLKDDSGDSKKAHVGADGEISDSWPEIFKAIDNGEYKKRYAVGNTKALDLGPEGVVHMQIAAFDTDERADGKGNAPITWISRELLKNERRMNPKCRTSGIFTKAYVVGTGVIGGWEHCELRAALQTEVWPLVPAEMRGRILEVLKEYEEMNKWGRSCDWIIRDRLWIPSCEEVFDGGYGKLFADDSSRKKKKVGSSSASSWWLRSAFDTNNVYGVNSSGDGSTISANLTYGVALGFCT